jgi:hypothetical protein
MRQASVQQARDRLADLARRHGANDPKTSWEPARELEQDTALLGRLMLACARHQDDAQAPDVSADEVVAALALFEQMRTRLDQLETQAVIEARRRGLDWKAIAEGQGLGSSQAASQRYQRMTTRLEEIRQGVR